MAAMTVEQALAALEVGQNICANPDCTFCCEERAVLTTLREAAADAKRYRWLRDNAGAWEVSRDLGVWTCCETGEKFTPKVYFTAHGTAYGGLNIDAAIDAAMGVQP